jgi:biotin carboxyl carrier protein
VSLEDREYSVEIQSDHTIAVDGFEGSIECIRVDPHTCSVFLNQTAVTVVSERSEGSYQVLLNHNPKQVRVETRRDRLLRQYSPSSENTRKRLEVRAPMPALIVRIEVAVGEGISPGQGLLVLEAMKMENEIKAHQAGRVKEIFVTMGAPVEKGQLLMLLE